MTKADPPQNKGAASRAASLRQLAANRANAQKSSGPRTAAGKAKSSMNAVKHGLTAVRIVLDGEDPAQFEDLRTRLLLEFEPQTALEEVLVDHLSGILWRLRRVPMLEVALFVWLAHTEKKDMIACWSDWETLRSVMTIGDCRQND